MNREQDSFDVDREGPVEIGEIGNIGTHNGRGGADLGGRRLKFGLPASGNHHRGAFQYQALCDAEPDSGAAACYDGDLAG